MPVFRKQSSAVSGRDSLDLIEEGVHLLRRAPLSAFGAYAFGAVPYVLGLLYFWSDMSRGALAQQRLVPAAFALALAHVWMRVWQTRFCTELAACVEHRAAPPWRLRDFLAAAGTHLRWGVWAWLALPVALLATVPFGWAFAFYQNLAAVDAPAADRPRLANRYAGAWPLQNGLAIAWLTLCGVIVLANVLVIVCVLPWLASTLFGLRSPMTRYPLWFLNTTVLCAALAAAYLVLDPLFKAVYVLRCFYAASVKSGTDLLTEWRTAQRAESSVARPARAGLVALALLLTVPAGLRAADAVAHASPPAAAPIAPARLDHAITTVLARPAFAWRMPRARALPDDRSWLARQFDAVGRFIARVRDWARDVIDRLADWLERHVREPDGPRRTTPAWSADSLAALIFALLALLAAAAIYVLWRARRRRRGTPAVTEPTSLPVTPDVADENVSAELLPEAEWMSLAERLRAAGEARKASRAYFLALLARLFRLGLVQLAKTKSNRDYACECRRRARGRPATGDRFVRAMAVFERGWYGEHVVSDDSLDALKLAVDETT